MDIDYLKKSGLKLVVGIIVSVFLILMNGMGWITPVYSIGNYVLEPMEYWSHQAVTGVDNFFGSVAHIGTLRTEIADLIIENAELKAETGKLSEVQRQNDILRAQLGIELTKEWKLKDVRILGIDQYGVAEHVIIDGGSEDGISKGDVVILGDLLIGEVRDVYKSTSKVRLVSNQKSNIFVIDQKTRAKGLVRGSLEGIVMEEVLESEELNEGDVVITWEDNIPGGLVVGTIVEVEDVPTSSTKRAFLETGFSLEDVQYVFVVTDF